MRVAFETTALELDATGTARAIRALQRELASRVDLVPIAHPQRGAASENPQRGAASAPPAPPTASEHPQRSVASAPPTASEHAQRGTGSAPPASAAARIARGLARELWWFPVGLPRAVRRARVDLLHCPAPLAPLRSPVPLVVTLYDTAGFDHPEWLTRENALHQRLVVAPALRRAARVLTSSEFARERIAQHTGVAVERIDVVPLGVDDVFTPGPVDAGVLEPAGVRRPYVLTVGTMQPRKNLETALAAFERLDDEELQLVVAGSRGWADKELVKRVRESSAADRIVLTGHVSDEELVPLYRGAECLVFPSRYEGFGLPPLEAMACGTPVVAANATSLPEVLGEAALLVDPLDADAFASAITEARKRRAPLSEQGLAHAAGFTWSRTASGVVATYEAAVADDRALKARRPE